jgi:hypothetical protein
MWTPRSQLMDHGRTIRISIDLESNPISFAEALRRWQSDAEYRSLFIGLLANSPFTAFRWETPPITTATSERPFEFVMLDCPGLARTPDADAFAEHFHTTGQHDDVIAFPNLGKDAIMVVPCPVGPQLAYGHLAAFVRQGPEQQVHSLWKLVGTTMQGRLNTNPVWLSTAGAGVSWLHVRLDDRPKYYGFAPYRDDV